MSNDMKLIMENWRKEVLNETPIKTVGEMKKIINTYRLAQAGKKTFKKGLEQVVEEIPVIGTIKRIWGASKDAKEIVAKMMGADDEFKTQTGLDRLNMNDNVSKIVDDSVEQNFINRFLLFLDSMDDNEPVPDVEEKFSEYLKSTFDQHDVKK